MFCNDVVDLIANHGRTFRKAQLPERGHIRDEGTGCQRWFHLLGGQKSVNLVAA